MNQIYRYSGPVSAVTLPDASLPKGRHVRLFPGGDVTLPDDNAYVRSLVARGYLTPVAAPAARTAASAASGVAQAGSKQAAASSPATEPAASETGKAAATAAASVANTKPTGE